MSTERALLYHPNPQGQLVALRGQQHPLRLTKERGKLRLVPADSAGDLVRLGDFSETCRLEAVAARFRLPESAVADHCDRFHIETLEGAKDPSWNGEHVVLDETTLKVLRPLIAAAKAAAKEGAQA